MRRRRTPTKDIGWDYKFGLEATRRRALPVPRYAAIAYWSSARAD